MASHSHVHSYAVVQAWRNDTPATQFSPHRPGYGEEARSSTKTRGPQLNAHGSTKATRAANCRPVLTCASARPHVSASIGFTADPRVSVERATNSLLRDAASLLIFQNVLKGPPAQAFLRLLLLLRRGDDSVKILEAHGEFFRAMADGEHASWQDYLLDSLLQDGDNPFVRAASKAHPAAVTVAANASSLEKAEENGAASSSSSATVPPSLAAAAAVDLDALQRLAIADATLVAWVCDIVSDVHPEWRSVASAGAGGGGGGGAGLNVSAKASSRNSTAGGDTSQVAQGNAFGFAGLAFQDSVPLATGGGQSGAVDTSKGVTPAADSPLVSDLPVPHSRDSWHDHIGSLWRWSEAVPLLAALYARTGPPPAAFHSDLIWSAGRLSPSLPSTSLSSHPPSSLSLLTPTREAIRPILERHVVGKLASHVLVCGHPGSGKTSIMRAELSRVLSSPSTYPAARVVWLSRKEAKNIASLLNAIRQSPHLRFCVFLDDLPLRPGEDTLQPLTAALSSSRKPWPSNALLCATSSASPDEVFGSGSYSFWHNFLVFTTRAAEISVPSIFGLFSEFCAAEGISPPKSEVDVQLPVERLKARSKGATAAGCEDEDCAAGLSLADARLEFKRWLLD